MDIFKWILMHDGVPSLLDAEKRIVAGVVTLAICIAFINPVLAIGFIGLSFIASGFLVVFQRQCFLKAYSAEIVQSHICRRFINSLTAGEGCRVEFFHPVEDYPGLAYCICCSGNWTGGSNLYFEGSTLIDCLEQADSALSAHKAAYAKGLESAML